LFQLAASCLLSLLVCERQLLPSFLPSFLSASLHSLVNKCNMSTPSYQYSRELKKKEREEDARGLVSVSKEKGEESANRSLERKGRKIERK
jgi:hypothetical protein